MSEDVPGFTCADPAFLSPSFFSLNATCADRWFLPPSVFMDVVPERRQGPAQLRGLRNSPRAMPLFGYELVRPELTCKESVLLCFH